MKVVWKAIPGFPTFNINQHGDVFRTLKFKKSVWTRMQPDFSSPYTRISLRTGGKRHRFSVHVLVCMTFIGPKPSPAHEVNHIDGNKRNNFYKNLEWVTKGENHRHRYEVLGQKGANLGRKFPKVWKDKCVKTLHWYGKPKDKFGFVANSRTSKAVAMYEKGAAASDVVSILNGPFLAALTKLKADGHLVIRENGIIKVIFKGS